MLGQVAVKTIHLIHLRVTINTIQWSAVLRSLYTMILQYVQYISIIVYVTIATGQNRTASVVQHVIFKLFFFSSSFLLLNRITLRLLPFYMTP